MNGHPRRGDILLAANVLVIFALALAVRLGYWSDARAYTPGGDEPDYVIPAQTLARDGVYVDTYVSRGRIWTRVPLTSLFFAGSFLFVGDDAARGAEGDDAALMERRYDALNLAQIAASLVTVGLTMLLAARCFPARGRGAAIAAGYISALYPPLASSPAQRALSEPLSITLLFAAIYALSWWSPRWRWGRMLWVAAGVGAMLGVAALARSVAVALVPFACIWMVWVYVAARRAAGENAGRRLAPLRWVRDNARPLLASVVLVAACLGAIAPWTYYNYRQYGSFLLLETANTTAYWHYHNFKRENEDTILRQYPDPADRLSVIVRKGTENILQYPDQALGSAVFAVFYAWHLESSSGLLLNTWDMTQRDPDLPDLLHTDAAFLLVGLMGLAGIAGLGLRRPTGEAGRTLLLLNLFLLMMLGLGVVVPYDARYRLPAAPALVVMAAGLLVLARWQDVFVPRRARAVMRAHRGTVALAALLCAWALAGAWNPSLPALYRAMYEAWRGDIALAGGDQGDAFGRYDAAIAAIPDFYWPYRHKADAGRQVGRDDEARALYVEASGWNPDDPYGVLGFADLLARHPDWRLTGGEARWLDRTEEEWRGNPWNSLNPTPTATVDVGTGRDMAYILGFHTPAQSRNPDFDYRWGQGRAYVRLPVPESATKYSAVRLRMSAPAVGPNAPMQVRVQVAGGPELTLTVPAGWAEYEMPLGAVAVPGQTITVRIESPTIVPAKVQPGSDDTRALGVGVDWVALVEGR